MQNNLIERGRKLFDTSSIPRVIFVLWLILNFFVLIFPISIGQSILKNSDKIYHFLFSFVTAFLFYFSFKKLKLAIFGSFLFPVLYGFFIEILQSFLPYRDFSIYDLFSDTLGGAFFILGFFLWKKTIIRFARQQL